MAVPIQAGRLSCRQQNAIKKNSKDIHLTLYIKKPNSMWTQILQKQKYEQSGSDRYII